MYVSYYQHTHTQGPRGFNENPYLHKQFVAPYIGFSDIDVSRN